MMGRDMYTDLAEELSSSYVWQSTVFSRRSAERFHFMDLMLFFSFSEAVCEDPPVCPTVSSSAIEWEQSIIEGHPTHPVRFSFFKTTYMLILHLLDAQGPPRSPTSPASRPTKQGLETSTDPFRHRVPLEARRFRAL